MRIAIIGAGHVGVVTAAGLAAKGHDVTCVDVDTAKIEQLRRGVPPFHEPGLEDLLLRHRAQLEATTDLRGAVVEADLSLVTVGTPVAQGEIDLAAIRAVAGQIGAALRDRPGYHVVAVKSTVVPGTTEQVVLPLLEQGSGKRAGPDFGVATNPEFLTEGEAVRDFLEPDRLVLGALDAKSLASLEALYQGFDGAERIRTNLRTAEMIKYTANCLLATAISFSNEIANLCSAVGEIDVAEVMRGVHASKYLSVTDRDGRRLKAELAAFLWPGCGFGGSCLPKDLLALISYGERAGQPMPLLRAVADVNRRQPEQVLAVLRKHFSSLADVTVAVLGLAFRPGTSDVRASPAIPIVHRLLIEGARVRAYDPAARAEARQLFPNTVQLCDDLPTTLAGADAAVLVTRWDEFHGLADALRATGRAPLLVDARRMLEKTGYERYAGIGL